MVAGRVGVLDRPASDPRCALGGVAGCVLYADHGERAGRELFALGVWPSINSVCARAGRKSSTRSITDRREPLWVRSTRPSERVSIIVCAVPVLRCSPHAVSYRVAANHRHAGRAFSAWRGREGKIPLFDWLWGIGIAIWGLLIIWDV